VTSSAAYSICVGLEDEFLAFNRLVGVVRRRNLAIESLSIGSGQEAGVARVTIVVRADEGAVDRLVRQLRKVIGVRGAAAEPEASVASRELALIRVRTTGDTPKCSIPRAVSARPCSRRVVTRPCSR
jgi:acetolactate synthase, small subunit